MKAPGGPGSRTKDEPNGVGGCRQCVPKSRPRRAVCCCSWAPTFQVCLDVSLALPNQAPSCPPAAGGGRGPAAELPHSLTPTPPPPPVGSAAVSKGAWLGLARGSLQHPLAWHGQEDVSPVVWPGRTLAQNAAGCGRRRGPGQAASAPGERPGYPSHTLPLLGLRVCGKLALDSLGWRRGGVSIPQVLPRWTDFRAPLQVGPHTYAGADG